MFLGAGSSGIFSALASAWDGIGFGRLSLVTFVGRGLNFIISALAIWLDGVRLPMRVAEAVEADIPGRVGAWIRIDIEGRVGVGLSIGFVSATGRPLFSILPLGVVSTELCFASNSSTSLVVGGIDVSSLPDWAGMGAFRFCECGNPSYGDLLGSSLLADLVVARVAAINEGDCCRDELEVS